MAIFKNYQKWNIVFLYSTWYPAIFRRIPRKELDTRLSSKRITSISCKVFLTFWNFHFMSAFVWCLLLCLMLHLISYIFGCQRRREEVALLLLQIPIVFFFWESLQSVHECSILYRNLTRTVTFTVDQAGKKPSWPWTRLARDQADHGPSWQETKLARN